MISGSTKLVALIGDPVERSLSPAIHNAAFKELGLNFVYVALRVPEGALADAIAGARALGVVGLNVTVPHKIGVLDLLDELDESASRVGAVNTIKNDGGKLTGFDTDGLGAVRALESEVGELKGHKVLLLGAGGAARAIAFSLVDAGAKLTLSNRTAEKSKRLAVTVKERAGAEVEQVELEREKLKEVIRGSDVLINATSVGMHPNTDRTLVTADMMRPGLVVDDIVYEPLRTRLLQEAEKAGARTVSGLGMLVHQAAASFEIWTGKEAPLEVMKAAAERELGGKK